MKEKKSLNLQFSTVKNDVYPYVSSSNIVLDRPFCLIYDCGMNTSQLPPYARLMAAAEVLFEEKGFHATGIDPILELAGVAKMTLYRNFVSKDELITAVLRLKSRKVLHWLEGEIARRARDGSLSKIEALFDAYGDWFEKDDFKGCLFMKAALEFPDPKHPAHKAAATHTRKLFSFIETLTPGAHNAEHVLLLLNGALSVAAMTGAGQASAKRALQAAKKLITT